MSGWAAQLGLVLLLAPRQEPTPPTSAEAELVRALLDDARTWYTAAELPPPEDIRALREEAERLAPDAELTRALGNLGHRLDQAGRGAEARALVTWAGARADALGDAATHSWALDWLAQNAWARGELETAAGLLAEAAALDAARDALAEQVRHLSDLARVRSSQGRLEEAERAVEQAEAAARAADSPAAVRTVAAIRGSLLFDLGRHRQALELCRAYGDGSTRDELQVRFDILAADVLADVGHLESAAVFARRALALALAPEIVRVAPLLHQEPRLALALLLGDLGRCDEALALLAESAAEFARLGDARGAAWTDKNRAFALFAAGRFDEALPIFERVWRAGAEQAVPFLEGFGALGVAETLVQAGGDLPADEERVHAALAAARRVAEEQHERTLDWRIAALDGALALAHGQYEAALVDLRHAVARIERWRRRLGASGLIEHALRQRSDPYRDAAFAAAHAGHPEQALEFASLLQSRVLDELCARADDAQLPADEPELARLRERLARLEARVRNETAAGARAELGRELEQAEDELDALRLEAELDVGRARKPRSRTPDGGNAALTGLGPALAAQGFQTALAYLVGARETLALRLDAGDGAHVETRVLPVGKAWLEARIERLRAPLERLQTGELDLAHLGFDLRAARELHEALVRPLALASGARVALVLDGVLAALPFELLVPAGEPGVVDFERPFAQLARLRFLADEHEFVAFGSFARLLRPIPAKTGEAVVFLAPDGLGVRHGEDEARALERALGAVRVVRDARPEDVAAGVDGAALVHFAVHGRIDAERPAHGHLVLGGVDGAGARLESWQAAELALDGATVVLSACHTGRGEWRAGAGLAGLTRGFLQAGAREVVASQWAVDDRVTARLMELFYAARARGLDTPAALRAARDGLRTETDPRGFALAHPAFWAAWFVQR